MKARVLGFSGLRVSVVGVGCNNFGSHMDERQTVEVVDAALAAGITHFDAAESYGNGESEVLLGKALGPRRDQAVIATKFAPRPPEEPYRPGALRRRILEGYDGSLKRLGTDHIDRYYQHRLEPAAPVGEALEALGELLTAGRVAHGASPLARPSSRLPARLLSGKRLPAGQGLETHSAHLTPTRCRGRRPARRPRRISPRYRRNKGKA